jgi:hypothetical protein
MKKFTVFLGGIFLSISPVAYANILSSVAAGTVFVGKVGVTGVCAIGMLAAPANLAVLWAVSTESVAREIDACYLDEAYRKNVACLEGVVLPMKWILKDNGLITGEVRGRASRVVEDAVKLALIETIPVSIGSYCLARWLWKK